MVWFNWFYDVLSYFGIYYKNAKIVFLGLDNAGKTTLLNVLKEDRVMAFQPTFQPSSTELIIGSTKFQAHDMGGHHGARKLWRDYLVDIHGIFFIVDATDMDRIAEAKAELHAILADGQLDWWIPIVILGNKVDNPIALSEQQLRVVLGVGGTTGKEEPMVVEGVRPIEVFMCSVVRKMGYLEGFQWLTHFLK